MIDCPHCGKRHRNPEGLEACAKRKAKHEERQERLAADKARREANATREPPAEYIRRRYGREQAAWVNIVSGLNKEYLPPEGKKRWALLDAIQLDNERLNWPF